MHSERAPPSSGSVSQRDGTFGEIMPLSLREGRRRKCVERYADLIVDILDALSFFLITPQLLRVADIALGVVVQGFFVIATISVCATPFFLITNNNISHNFDYRFMIPETYGYPFLD
jgi:hypothetical protein